MAIMEIVHFCCCAYDSLFNNLDLSESIPLLFYIIYYLILHEYFFSLLPKFVIMVPVLQFVR